ncbi:hypothetical protein H6P81_002310 [Aristolochia fimbriata]|uniref:Uncharacterized protein n=1 Tax=Aristolochia fimbriata TaxID=158543 RepID=A0AAV7FDH8_ARIFI|nr:hypothetical protein H6P81_002310 [Aristolochia fimbriata]
MRPRRRRGTKLIKRKLIACRRLVVLQVQPWKPRKGPEKELFPPHVMSSTAPVPPGEPSSIPSRGWVPSIDLPPLAASRL